MDILKGVNLFIETYARILRGFKSVRLLAPFLLLTFFKAVVLAALVSFYLPPVHKVLVPILSYFYSDQTLHYPRYFIVLPQIYNYSTSLAVEFIFGIVLMASAVFVIGTDFKRERGGIGEGLRTAGKSLFPLIVIWSIKTALVILAFNYGGRFILRMFYGMPYADFIGYCVLHAVGIIVTMLFIYAIPAIMLHRQGLFVALASSFKLSLKHPLFSFFLLFIPWLIHFPLNYLIFTKVHVILIMFSHNALVYLLSLDIVISLITNFLIYAGITYFYMQMME